MPAQELIVKIEGPPGSGKSRELAREACRLVAQEGIPAERILMLAVTEQNRRRLSAYLQTEAELAGLAAPAVQSMTLDAFLLALLPEARLLSDRDARLLLQEILREAIPDTHPLAHARRQPSLARVFFELIRQLQLLCISPADLSDAARRLSDSAGRLPLLAEIYGQFTQRTRQAGLMCHGELLHAACQKVLADADHRKAWQARFAVILIDEAQELAEAHHRLLAALNLPLVLAGNEKLSIRRFRGADPQAYQSLAVYNGRPVTYIAKQACMRGNAAVLSLLNRFLPQPVWEEQAADTAQLAELVRFGFYADPEREAAALADWLDETVRGMTIADRPARWDDCVILLRSSHYRHHLINALVARNIPFRAELFTEGLVRLQHYVYDALRVLEDWQVMGLRATMLADSQTIERCLDAWQAPAVEKLALVERCNRHLRRWLEAELAGSEAASDLRHLRSQDPARPDDWIFLPMQLADATLSPAIRHAMARLGDWLDCLLDADCMVALCERIRTHLVGRLADEDGLLDGLDAFRLNLARLDGHYRRTFEKGLPLTELCGAFERLWEGMDGNVLLAWDPDLPEGRVRLLSIHQMQGEEAPVVLIPFLASEELPQSREMPEVLTPDDMALLGTDLIYRIDEAEEARLLAVAMTRATHRLVLSCHAGDANAPVLPSPFYTRLLAFRRTLLNQPGGLGICACLADPAWSGPCGVDLCARSRADGALDDADARRYVGDSIWAGTARQNPEPLFEPDETLHLSASAIKTYMSCPRQFYYRHLLRLPQPGSEAATLGSLVHRLLEVFNRQAAAGAPYAPERLRTLAETMFAFSEDPDAFEAAGFDDKDRRTLQRLGALALSTLRVRLLEAIDDLAAKGYFARYGGLRTVRPEMNLSDIRLEGLDRCRFTGVVDALIQLEDGSWEILDYKTFRSAYSAGLDTCDKHFQATLEPLPEDADLGHDERFGAKLSPTYPKDYQLPLYYLACSQDPAYRERLRAVALQIVRPTLPDKPFQGSIRLEILAREIEARKDRMIADIRRFIVDPVLGESLFAVSDSRASCGSCGYFGICDVGGTEDPGRETL